MAIYGDHLVNSVEPFVTRYFDQISGPLWRMTTE